MKFFVLYTAGVVLFIGAAFFILLYFIGISVGKGFAVFISVLYFFVPFLILSMENIRRALLIFSRTVFNYLADYGQSKNIFYRILQNTSVDMQTGNVEFLPFVVGILGITLWLILFMAIAVDNAILNVPPIYKKAALTMGANQKQIYWKVIFPASLPELISGMKQGWSFAWRQLMSGEVMTTSIGLGQTLMTGRNLADINQVMLVMVVIVVVGILIDQVVFYNVEKRVLKKRGL